MTPREEEDVRRVLVLLYNGKVKVPQALNAIKAIVDPPMCMCDMVKLR